MEYSYTDVLRDLLPALPIIQQNHPNIQASPQPVHVHIERKFDPDPNRNMAWTSERKYILDDESMWVQAQVQVQPGQNVKFRILLGNADEEAMALPTPIKLRWTVSLRKDQLRFDCAGSKSCFVPVPVGDSINKSASTKIDFNHIPRDMRQGEVTSEWEINAEWFTPDNIGDDLQKASLSLHHLADVLEDKHAQ